MTTRDETAKPMVSVRVPEKVRARLEMAAKLAGWSMTIEIVRRLERSLDDDERDGGPHTAALLRMISASIQLTETLMGASWVQDGATRAACASAVAQCLMAYIPQLDLEKNPEFQGYVEVMRLRQESAIALGREVADRILKNDELEEGLSRSTAMVRKLSKIADAVKEKTVQNHTRNDVEIAALAIKSLDGAKPDDPLWMRSLFDAADKFPGGPAAFKQVLASAAIGKATQDEAVLLEAEIVRFAEHAYDEPNPKRPEWKDDILR